MCTRCKGTTVAPFRLCEACRENRREYAAAHRAQGMCADCNIPVYSGRSRCSLHAAARRR
jgi:hypothetical protein